MGIFVVCNRIDDPQKKKRLPCGLSYLKKSKILHFVTKYCTELSVREQTARKSNKLSGGFFVVFCHMIVPISDVEAHHPKI